MSRVQVAIIGGGASGRAIQRSVERRGAEARLLSRSSGFDVLHDDVSAAIGDADVVVEAAGVFTTSRAKAAAFFTASTRAVAAATNRSGARHVLLSIVNCTLPEVQGYGYFAGKTAQEQVARAESRSLTIVRSTQWFEFAGQNLTRLRFGRLALVPGMTIQPVALDSVARVIADVAVGDRTAALVEVAGPERTTLWDMTTALRQHAVRPVPLPIPGRMGRAFRAGALLPAAEVETTGPRFEEWLAAN